MKKFHNVGVMGGLVRFSVLREIREKFCRSFLDLIIALTLLRSGPISGYRMLTLIYKNFGILVAPSVLYPMLHSMEEKKLIKREKIGKRSGAFYLTDDGRSWVIERLNALTRVLADLERKSRV